MLKSLAVVSALLCASIPAHAMDPRCNGPARYEAMREADSSGHGTGHACAPVVRVPETCVASQYGIGDGYHGKRTASGERFNTWALTAAHRTRPFGSSVVVTNRANGRTVTVRINDRGPFVRGRCIDLSRAAANAIGMGGTARVSVQ